MWIEWAPRRRERVRFKACLTNEIKLSEKCSSWPIKLSVCSSAAHVRATFTITTKHAIKHKLLLSWRGERRKKKKGLLSSHIHIFGWRHFFAAFLLYQKRTQEIAVAINLGWPHQGWYCISFPLSETLILEIHVTLAHFNFMFSYDSKLSRSSVIIKTAYCYAMLYRNISGALCRIWESCILQALR